MQVLRFVFYSIKKWYYSTRHVISDLYLIKKQMTFTSRFI